MAKEIWDKPIDKNTDWGGDASTGNLPVSGNRVQEFIKGTLDKKGGIFYYDSTNNRYLVFSDEYTRDEYLEDPQKVELILGTFEAPFNYSAEINLISESYVAILVGAENNYIDFTFDVKNKQGNSTGEDVVCTYTFIRNSTKKTVTQKYKYGTSVHFNIDAYLETGTNNIIIGIVGQNSLAATTVAVTYQVIDLQLTDTTDISKVYNLTSGDGMLEIPYTISGVGAKTMEWYLDGEQLSFIKDEDEIVETSSTRTKYITLSGLTEGKHNIQFRASSIYNGEKFYSKILYRDIIIYKTETLNSIIAVAITLPIGQEIIKDGEIIIPDAIQYIPYKLNFAVFNPNASNTKVDIYLDDVLQTSIDAANNVVNEYELAITTSGSKVLSIRTETTTYDIPITIKKSDTDLSEITQGLTLALTAVGKNNNSFDKDIWEYGDYTTEFNGFAWNKISGWINNSLLITNGASININIKPLYNDALINGKTLEFEFATRNVSNDNAVVCDLTNPDGSGILITASEVVLKSVGGAKVSTKYKSEENIRISLVINKKENSTNKCLAFIYINGVISGAVNFTPTDSFRVDKELTFSSTSDTDIELKSLRFYDTVLTSDQILNNYILYRTDAKELVQLYDRNNIYKENSVNFSVDALSGQLPIMIVTGDIPALENTSDKNLTIDVDVDYINLQDQTKSFKVVDGAMRPQGTSSMSYPKKNFRLYTRRKETTKVYDYNGKEIKDKLYAFKDNAQPVDCWCMKADYAESSGTHNTGIARLWNDALKNVQLDGKYACRTKAQQAAIDNEFNYDVRTTIDGFPILMFYRLTPKDDLIFIGKYNFNNDKSTESVFGFEDIPGFDNARMQCWEVLNNGNHLALFQDVNNFDEEWEDAFEARYPDEGSDANTADLKAFCEWIVSTKDDIEKFKREKADHIDLNKMAAYYVYFMRFGAVDQTVKNAMFTSEDGEHFYYINYDNDTINGVRNDGLLIYGPTIDRQSIDETFTSTVYCYAGHESTLWNNLEKDEEFMKLVSDIDNALYVVGLSYKNVIEIFDTKQCDMWCERVYNQDAQYKYIGPYANNGINNLYMLQGKRQSHRRWWLSRRFNYLDAKFASGEYRSNTFEIKVANAPMGIEFSLTAGFDMNYGYGVNNVPIETGIALNKGQSHTFTTKQVLNIGDPLRIYSAVNLEAVDIHNFIEYLSTVNMDKVYNDVLGTKLKRLILGVDVATDVRRNESLNEISGLRQAKRLEYLDISGYKKITSLDLTDFNYFTTLKAKQSGLTSVEFAEGALLTLAELPDTLQTLRLNSINISVNNLKIENTWASLRHIEIKNCPNFRTNFDYFFKWYNEKEIDNNLCTLIIEGINWNNIEANDLIQLGQLKLDDGTLNLKGKIRLTDSSEEIINQLKEIFGNNCFNPNNDLYISAPDAIYVSGPTEFYEGDSVQYTAAVFSENRGEITYSIINGNTNNQFEINSKTGLLTSVEKGISQKTITVRVTHRPTQGVPTNKDLIVTVKPRIYPKIIINGDTIVNKELQEYTISYNPTEYNGTFTLQWSLEGNAYTQGYIQIESQNNTRCRIRMIKTSAEVIEGTLKVIMTKGYGGTSNFTKLLQVIEEGIIMTSKSNPEVMKVCYAQGWTLSPDKMTEDEAAAVITLGAAFKENDKIETFNELQYFTGLTEIADSAFYSYNKTSKLRSITLPPNIKTIENNAFGFTRALKELIIPTTLNDLIIDAYAFRRSGIDLDVLLNINATNVIINGSGSLATSNWHTKENIIFKKSIFKKVVNPFEYITTTIRDTLSIKKIIIENIEYAESILNCANAMSSDDNKTGFSDIEIEVYAKEISRIIEGGYNHNNIEYSVINKLKKFTLGNGVEKIKHNYINESLVDYNKIINLPKTIKEIPYVCFKIAGITMNEEGLYLKYNSDNGLLIKKEDNSIYRHYGYRDIEFTYDETYGGLGNNAFYKSGFKKGIFIKNVDTTYLSNTKFKEFEFREGSITKLTNQSFNGNDDLIKITLPNINNIQKPNYNYISLSSCKSLQEIIMPENDNYKIIDKRFVVDKTTSTLMMFAQGNITEITIPNEIKIIGGYCFYEMKLITKVILNEGITEIGEYAFRYCTSLADVNFPSSLRTINDYSFSNTALVNVIIPEGVIYCLQALFSCNKLQNIEFPSTIDTNTHIQLKGCTNLQTLKINSLIAPRVFTDSFGNSSSNYTGRNTYNTGENKLIVPENATGYDMGVWLDPLCNSEKCGFTLEKSLPAVETIETLSAKNKALTEQNSMLMAFAAMSINTMSLSVDDSLAYKNIYPKWEDEIGNTVKPPFKFRYGEEPNDKLYEVIKEHTLSKEWIPGNGTTSLYKVVSKDAEAGTIDNPIEWSKGMELINGKYYIDAGVKYKCIRDSGMPLEYALADLVSGGFVEPVNN